MHKPTWFRDGQVLFSNASTCGINKDGEELYVFDSESGLRTDAIDDRLHDDVRAVLQGNTTPTVQWASLADVRKSGVAVPVYYDQRSLDLFEAKVAETWSDATTASLGDLAAQGIVEIRNGHGSPSADMRTGSVPYIKVSDLRAGQVNVNPTNRVPQSVATHFWKGGSSGLRAYDLLTPSRTSKNIGDMAVLMPGQENVVVTKEVLVFRPGKEADFDAFYLLWAMSLRIVREQWRRIVFMQTNREDTGLRYREIKIPLLATSSEKTAISQPFRDYYQGIAQLQEGYKTFLAQDDMHHIFLAGSANGEDEQYDEAEPSDSDLG